MNYQPACSHRNTLLAAGLLVCLLFSACSQSDIDSFSHEVVDPDGIRAIENGSVAANKDISRQRLYLRDLASFGDPSTGNLWIGRSNLKHHTTFGPNGTYGYVESDPPELRSFSQEGTLLWTAGREGEGPGEFRTPYFLQYQPEVGWLVFDIYMYRLCVFDELGQSVATTSYRDLPESLGPLALYSAGTHNIWYLAQRPTDQNNPIRRHVLYLGNWESEEAGESLAYPAPTVVETIGRNRYFQLRAESYAVDSQYRFWLNHVPEYMIEVIAPDNDRFRIRRTFKQQPYPDEYREEIETTPRYERNPTVFTSLPDLQPAISGILSAPHHHMWVLTGTIDSSPYIQVDVFNASGEFEDSFLLDRTIEILAIEDGRLLRQGTSPNGDPLLILSEYWIGDNPD